MTPRQDGVHGLPESHAAAAVQDGAQDFRQGHVQHGPQVHCPGQGFLLTVSHGLTQSLGLAGGGTGAAQGAQSAWPHASCHLRCSRSSTPHLFCAHGVEQPWQASGAATTAGGLLGGAAASSLVES